LIGPVNILSEDKQTYLEAGKYKILCLGGWGVEVNDFSINFKDVNGTDIFSSRKTRWRVQSYAFNKRAIRIGTVEVLKSGIIYWSSYILIRFE